MIVLERARKVASNETIFNRG